MVTPDHHNPTQTTADSDEAGTTYYDVPTVAQMAGTREFIVRDAISKGQLLAVPVDDEFWVTRQAYLEWADR